MLTITPLPGTSDIATCATFAHVTAHVHRRMTRINCKGAPHAIQRDCRRRSGNRGSAAARSCARRPAVRGFDPGPRRLRYSGRRFRSALARRRSAGRACCTGAGAGRFARRHGARCDRHWRARRSLGSTSHAGAQHCAVRSCIAALRDGDQRRDTCSVAIHHRHRAWRRVDGGDRAHRGVFRRASCARR